MAMPNEALQKLLQEIESKAIFAQQQMAIVKAQMDTAKRDLRKLELTTQEISSLPNESKMYEGVGKMFIATPSTTVHARLEREQGDLKKKLVDLDKKYTFLETTFKNSQEHLDRVFKSGGR